MGIFCFFNHDMKTIAIDTRHGWQSTNRITDETKDNGQHIVVYSVCSRCGKREMKYDDATEPGREYAENGHSGVAKVRAIWLGGGPITTKVSKKITWIDPSYAPLGGFEPYLAAMKNDPELKDMMKDHKMVDDALGQLEVAIKLCQNNKSVTP